MPSVSAESREERIERLFHAALEIESGSREAFLERACDGDDRRAVRRLLEAHARVGQKPGWNAPAIENEAFRAAAVGDTSLDRYRPHKWSEGDERLQSRVEALLDALEKADAGQVWEANAIQRLAADSLETDLDRYRLIEQIGSGGMGAVYKAVRAADEFSKLVAVKIVLIPDHALIVRFRRERQMLAGLEHPNIARLLDGGTSKSGSPFLVMEYVDGIPIHRYVEQHRLPVHDILALLRKVCSAVSHAHRNLIVHRDLKPANILVTSDGEPKLLDFGIAKLMDPSSQPTRTGLHAMTPEYASPEQIRSEAITTATDVYSLGVILYELLTGSRPYRHAESPVELAEAITKEQPASMKSREKRFDPELENIVQMALRKEPERRYASVDLFSEDLHRLMTGLPVAAHRDSVAYRANKFARRHSVSVAAAALAVIALLVGIAGTAWQAHAARIERARADRRFNDVRRLADSFLFEFNASIEGIPGTLAARQLLVKRALEYLDGLAQEAGDDRALESELAGAYEKVGTITFDVSARLAIHQKQLGIRESLARAEPSNATYRQQLAESYISVGDATKDIGNLRGALENYQRALAIDSAIGDTNPSKASAQSDAANAFELVGQTLARMGETDESIAAQSKALAIIQHATDIGLQAPDFPQLTMVIHHGLAAEFANKGDLPAAMAEARESLRLAGQMSAANPANATNRRNIWASNIRIANVLVKAGDVRQALASYRAALEQIRKLAAADPGDKGHRRALAITYLGLADAFRASGGSSSARSNYKLAISTSEALLAADPNKLETRVDLAGMYMHLGMCYRKSGDRRLAADFLKKGREFFNAALSADPANADIKRGKAEADAQFASLQR
jgi:tetratricopeptide (TPR) repeat protein